MRLREIETEKLLGFFNHHIPLNMDERITIIHSPNGFGKTAILRLIAGVFESHYSALRELPYERLQFGIDDGTCLSIAKELVEDKRTRRVRLTFGYPPNEPFHLMPLDRNEIPFGAIDDFIPHLVRVESHRWVYNITGEMLDIDDVLERFADDLPPPFRERAEIPDWLKRLSESLDVHFIRANRLESLAAISTRRGVRGNVPTSVVARYANELAEQIRTTLAQYAELSQSLDRSFPMRLVTSSLQAEQTMDQVQKKLSELEKKRSALTDAGLLDKEEHPHFRLPPTIEDTKRDVLSVYISDVEKKLAVFDNIFQKISVFKNILNKRFLFKTVTINKTDGIVFHTSQGDQLGPFSLSSGEQHEVVLLYQLLFKVKPDSLILIDEPELSLHIAWQEQFLKDLAQITALSKFDVLIATHSPQIISDRWDLTVELKKPSE